MKPHSNRSEPRVPMSVLCLAGAVVGGPFFLLALALTSLNRTWLMFAVTALPVIALGVLWSWLRRLTSAGSNESIGTLAPEAYPPGA